ncbi:MAG: hypothetical protein SFT68_01350, partial [Rickettsiaceae bacterium]|nr:hypothetical protein [Rickettsiaceae bacterium]
MKKSLKKLSIIYSISTILGYSTDSLALNYTINNGDNTSLAADNNGTITYSGTGTFNVSTHNQTGDIDFAGNNGTLSIGKSGHVYGGIYSTGLSAGNISINANGARIYGNVGTSAYPINSLTINGLYTTTIDGPAINVLNVTSAQGILYFSNTASFYGNIGTSSNLFPYLSLGANATLLDGTIIYAQTLGSSSGGSSILNIDGNVIVSGNIGLYTGSKTFLQNIVASDAYFPSLSYTRINDGATLSVIGNSVFYKKVDATNSGGSASIVINPGTGNTIYLLEHIGTIHPPENIYLGAGNIILGYSGLKPTVSSTNLIFIDDGSIAFADTNNTISISNITTTTNLTGSITLPKGNHGNIGQVALKLKTLNVAQTGNSSNNSSDVYLETLNVGNGSGYEYVLSGGNTNIENIYIGASDHLVITSSAGAFVNVNSSISSDHTSGSMLHINSNPSSANFPNIDILVDNVFFTQAGTIDRNIFTSTSNTTWAFVVADISLTSGGVLNIADSGLIFICDEAMLTNSDGTINLGTNVYITDYSPGNFDQSVIDTYINPFRPSGVNAYTIGSGTFKSSAGGVLPQIGSGSGDTLTNLVLAQSSVDHYISGNIYANNTYITSNATVNLSANTNIAGNL